jgi:hypothetical protein
VNLAETVHHREGPGPGSLVDGAVEADLRQAKRRRLERERNVDVGMTLVDGETKIDAGCEPRAEPSDAAKCLALVADEITLRIGPDRDAVPLDPGAVARIFRALGRAAAAGVGAECTVKPARRLIAEPFQKIRPEIECAVACRQVVVGRCR